MAYPCLPGPTCKICTAKSRIWAELLDNHSFCCFEDAEEMPSVAWATDDPLECPEAAINYAKCIEGFLLGLFFIFIAAVFVWFFIRPAFCRTFNVPVVFEHSDAEDDDDSGYESGGSGSGGSDFEASTTDSNAEENHEHSE